MRFVRPCSSCAAPVTIKMVRCPHCGQSNPRGILARTGSTLAAIVGGLTVSSTLSACYGAPCAQGDDTNCIDAVPTCSMVSSQAKIDDMDGDGYCLAFDCNERDKTVNASAHDIPGDGIDQNCDGKDAR